MRSIFVTELKPGSVLRGGLWSPFGAKLVAPGTLLTDKICETLRRSSQQLVLLGDEPLRRQVGAIATTNAPTSSSHDPDRELLRIRARLRRSAEAIAAARGAKWPRLPLRIAPSSRLRPTAASGSDAANHGPDPAGRRAERVALVERVFTKLAAGTGIHVGVLADLVDELIDLSNRHASRYAQLALHRPADEDYLPGHAYTVGVLSVGIAARLGWSARDVRSAGLAGLLADVGMMLVPGSVRGAQRPLDETESNTVRRHPIYAMPLLDLVRDLPEEVPLAVYQHHEREDGTGYPHGLRSVQVHDIAKVIAVADTFAAATAVRPYRPSVLPFDALRQLIQSASAGTAGTWPTFDRATVRALVGLCGLFPVGSCVQLSTGVSGIVVAHTDPERPDRPTVRIAPATGGGDLLDLARLPRTSLHVLQAVEAA